MEASAVLSATDTQARKNAKGMAGWMKFVGIVTIICGVLNALSIIGILWAWAPIWLGVVLSQAGSKASEYAEKGDTASLDGMTGKLRFYFMLCGIVMIVSIAAAMIAAAGWAVLIATGVFSPSSLMDYFNRFR